MAMTLIDLKLDNDGLRVHVHANMRTPRVLVSDHADFMSVDIWTGDEQVCLYLSPQQARQIGEQLLATTRCGACGAVERAINNKAVCANCGSMTTC